MAATGVWYDTTYAACCFMGARCKQQRLRHNIQEIADWPVLECHHLHRADEWEPWIDDEGQTVYPSKEEAEYTAFLGFAIAVSVSWWAARNGFAKLQVMRWPTYECVGRREHWIDLDPRCLRERSMAPLAISLGLRPTRAEWRSRTPTRCSVESCLQPDKSLSPGTVYVGRGHHSHRLPVTKWASPYVPGHNCAMSDWLPQYIEHIMTSGLKEDLAELCGCRLACDCPAQSPCEADVLAGLTFTHVVCNGQDQAKPKAKRRKQPRGRQAVAAILGAAGIPPTVGAVIPYTTQEAVVLAFRSLYPGDYFQNFLFPLIEDLVNAPPFTCFPQWLRSQEKPWDGALGPILSPTHQRLLMRTAEGQQAGAVA